MPTSKRITAPAGAVADSVANWLAQSPVFSGLGPEELRVFAESSELRHFAALEEAVIEGVVPEALNIVVSGRFIVLLNGATLARFGDSAMVSLDCYLAGDSFGEATLIESEPAPAVASVVATEASQVVSIDGANFRRVAKAHGDLAQIVYRNLFAIQTRRLNILSE